MRHELEVTLRDSLNDVQLTQVLEAYDLLNALGLSSHDTELQNILGLQDGISDTATYIDRIHTTLILALGYCLSQYGVVLADDTPLPIMTKVVHGLANFEQFIQPSYFYGILTSDELSPEEQLAEILPVIVNLEYELAVEFIVVVRQSAITRMLSVVEEVGDHHPEEESDPKGFEASTAQLLNALQALVPEQPLYVFTLAKSGWSIGTSLGLVLEESLEHLEESVEDLRHVPELLAIYLFCTPGESIWDSFDRMLGDLEELSGGRTQAAERYLRQLIKELGLDD